MVKNVNFDLHVELNLQGGIQILQFKDAQKCFVVEISQKIWSLEVESC